MLIAATIIVFSACGGDKPLPDGPLDVRIKAISSGITQVSEEGETLKLTYSPDSTWDEYTWLFSLFIQTRDIFSRLQEATKGKMFSYVVFDGYIPTRNNLGEESKTLVLSLSYKTSDLKGAKWDKVATFDMSALASDVRFRHPIGKNASKAYCKKWADVSGKFCAKVY
jgi:hypothetical protein